MPPLPGPLPQRRRGRKIGATAVQGFNARVSDSENSLPEERGVARLHKITISATVSLLMSEGKAEEVLQKAPTLYAITLFKLGKGLVAAFVALMLYTHADRDLQAEYQNLLDWLHHWLKVNPEQEFWTNLAIDVDKITEVKRVRFAAGTLIYGRFSVVEGFGLMFRIKWAGWMTISESASSSRLKSGICKVKPSWFVFGILVANIIIVWYTLPEIANSCFTTPSYRRGQG